MTVSNDRAVIETGPSIGVFHDAQIPAYYISADGSRFVFDHVAVCDPGTTLCSISQLKADEALLSPGLIYRLENTHE